jgi:hypothetical protein
VTIRLTLSRTELANGDYPGEPLKRDVSEDTTVAQALTLGPPLHPSYTWVAYHQAANTIPGKAIAAVRDGRVGYVVAPDTPLKKRGIINIQYESAYYQNVDELTAVLRAGGVAGPMKLRPLRQPRNNLLRQLDSHRTEQAQDLLKLAAAGDIDVLALLQFADGSNDQELATHTRYWANLRDNPRWQVADRCSLALHEHGYYERQRALETRATAILPYPPSGWDYEPVALGLHLSVIRDVPIQDPQFRHDLATLAEFLT